MAIRYLSLKKKEKNACLVHGPENIFEIIM